MLNTIDASTFEFDMSEFATILYMAGPCMTDKLTVQSDKIDRHLFSEDSFAEYEDILFVFVDYEGTTQPLSIPEKQWQASEPPARWLISNPYGEPVTETSTSGIKVTTPPHPLGIEVRRVSDTRFRLIHLPCG